MQNLLRSQSCNAFGVNDLMIQEPNSSLPASPAPLWPEQALSQLWGVFVASGLGRGRERRLQPRRHLPENLPAIAAFHNHIHASLKVRCDSSRYSAYHILEVAAEHRALGEQVAHTPPQTTPRDAGCNFVPNAASIPFRDRAGEAVTHRQAIPM